ncbi:MAG: Flagellar hook-basal body complex protein FliE [Thermotoga sp. 50_1627]|uniref:flagellar hook-basal body complex protein FliE n=1 Tax=Pseudothermotoga sp. TaxID=2033661 RepID=UPI00076D1351|nr:MAG: Flagellar hook-basal body complex protein FliE [Thermotoga sp. 50_64]KUK25232.1 MAG: Flagellar hook-basal body complex protein FliE [Thermotoga sp. 50_1627]MBC7116264.1 flagellar hook-basal body complex protein FliE [Pseudothermotoga sp.]MDK2923298.1 flagellar hook-basal body complex protein FliE [Pseudothermotoga sp.]HBT38712.1 flagellar hook-basal body complex protein FliE [Pseudothermotoga sp.]
MIDGISGIGPSNVQRLQQDKTLKNAPDFAEILKEAFDKVNQVQKNAEQMASDFALGKISNIHEVIIEAEKATIALRLTTEVRNRIVEAYREIMRMQL